MSNCFPKWLRILRLFQQWIRIPVFSHPPNTYHCMSSDYIQRQLKSFKFRALCCVSMLSFWRWLMPWKLLWIGSARSYVLQWEQERTALRESGVYFSSSILGSFVQLLPSPYYCITSLTLKWKEANFKSQEHASCGFRGSGILQNGVDVK